MSVDNNYLIKYLLNLVVEDPEQLRNDYDTSACSTMHNLSGNIRKELLDDGWDLIELSRVLDLLFKLLECIDEKSEETLTPEKYLLEVMPGVKVDVYDILLACNVKCPALSHGIKKMLLPGARGAKDSLQDKEEAIVSIKRSIQLEKQKLK
tara:strand:- start:47 stop:499 length:453 start_codon:yes stop_codon:yes gene_type:complete